MPNLEEIIAAVEAAEAGDEAYQDEQLRQLAKAVLALYESLINAHAELGRIRGHLREAGTR